MTAQHASPVGSEWHRWDPHIHAPGTLLADRFSGDWEGYIAALEAATPVIEAVGVTDYYCLETYKRVRAYKDAGRLPKVQLLFPNVEFRLDLQTEKKRGINIHLLFSPEAPDHVQQIERILLGLTRKYGQTTYVCRPDDLARLGRAVDPKQTDDTAAMRIGANQFKVSFEDLRGLFTKDERWMRKYCLVAVSGAEHDGTEGLKNDSSFAEFRKEIETFAHIIFSGAPSTRDFWLGAKPGMDREWIEARYGVLKPCLVGSDAHRPEDIGRPNLDRLCWIKADLTFEGLRQAVLEPAERVLIGPKQPGPQGAFNRLRAIRVAGAPWFTPDRVPLNPGLVAIIGARGSGKTALADVIASGASALSEGAEDSFVRRASHPVNFLAGSTVTLEWSDDTTSTLAIEERAPSFGEDEEEAAPQVRYLSQQFVERLCSKDGMGRELVREIERVVFDATDETEKFGATTFEALKSARIGHFRAQRAAHIETIEQASKAIGEEEALRESLGGEKKKLEALGQTMKAARKELEGLVPQGQEARAKQLAEMDAACSQAESAIQRLRLKKQSLEELAAEAGRIVRTVEPQRLNAMKSRYQAANLTSQEWARFEMRFAGDVEEVTTRLAAAAEAEVEKRLRHDPSKPAPAKLDASSPLSLLRAAREAAAKAVGVDEVKSKRFQELQVQLAKWDREEEALKKRIEFIEGAEGRRDEHVQTRRAAYLAIFDTLLEAQKTLEDLYKPLLTRLQTVASAAKMQFVVVRKVDVEAWVKLGEDLLDFRSATDFRGKGTLKRLVEEELLEAWQTGTSAQVAQAMHAFIEKHKNSILAGRPTDPKPDELRDWWYRASKWLHSAEHIRLQYGLRYDGIDVQRLSPGTRGIVLLTLYLAIDEWDRRPLIVDQPEENLDPKSVFNELVGFFRDARSRRQVILVTHNANLVVNTDADQVVVASASRTKPEGLPDISYVSGSLENKAIRDQVCELLEGGEKAFLERERRYRLERTAVEAPKL